MAKANRYERIIERIFLTEYRKGVKEVPFKREDIERVAGELGIKLPKNLGDVIYSFRYRSNLPKSITSRAPAGKHWIIRPAGRSRYVFVANAASSIVPNHMMAETKIPDSTPGVIERYAFNDEQALLAKLRYNRLIDIFTGVACYSLQSHLRTFVTGIGQVETDELYIGIDRRGSQYVIPVQAKGGKDKLSIVQIEQDFALCVQKFPSLICRAMAAQFLAPDLITLFEFEKTIRTVATISEKHYRLVPSDEVTDEDLQTYGRRSDGEP